MNEDDIINDIIRQINNEKLNNLVDKLIGKYQEDHCNIILNNY